MPLVAIVPLQPQEAVQEVAFVNSAAFDCVPLTALEPVQPPLTVQELPVVADQLRVAASPLVTVLGLLETAVRV